MRQAEVVRDSIQELKNQDYVLREYSNIRVEFANKVNKDGKDLSEIFISHASEDKDTFVRPLADELISLGIAVWYDEYALSIGDSLRSSIDKGLAQARYGLIIISESFMDIDKNWTKYELNGLIAKEMEGEKVVLPIWHQITKKDLMEFSPTLADKVALDSSLLSVREIATKISDAIK